MEPPLSPFHHVKWSPSPIEAWRSHLDLLEDPISRNTRPTPAAQRLSLEDAASLDDYIFSFSGPDFSANWRKLERHRINPIPPPRSGLPVHPRTDAGNEGLVKEWATRIWCRQGREDELTPMMGFHPGNRLSISDIHVLVYLMLRIDVRSEDWRLYPFPRSEDSEPLSWRDVRLLEIDDLLWELEGDSAVEFCDPPLPYWHNLLQPAVPDDYQSLASGMTQTSKKAVRHFSPRAVIKQRDRKTCRLCNMPALPGCAGVKHVVGHIIPHSVGNHIYSHRILMDPASYISTRLASSPPSNHCEAEESEANGYWRWKKDSDEFSLIIAAHPTDHPTNLFYACYSCERMFDASQLAVNIFGEEPRRIIALSYPNELNGVSTGALQRFCQASVPVDLQSSPYAASLPTILPSETFLLAHLVSFLSLRCRIVPPISEVPIETESSQTGSSSVPVINNPPVGGERDTGDHSKDNVDEQEDPPLSGNQDGNLQTPAVLVQPSMSESTFVDATSLSLIKRRIGKVVASDLYSRLAKWASEVSPEYADGADSIGS